MRTDTHTRTLCTLCLSSQCAHCEECRSTRLTTVAAIGRWKGMSQAADAGGREQGPATPFWHENWNLLKNDYSYRNLWLSRCCEFQVNLFMLWQVITQGICGPLGYRAPALSFALTKADFWMVLVLVSRLLSWVISPTMTPRLALGVSLIKCQ